jgi:hypothetical protein
MSSLRHLYVLWYWETGIQSTRETICLFSSAKRSRYAVGKSLEVSQNEAEPSALAPVWLWWRFLVYTSARGRGYSKRIGYSHKYLSSIIWGLPFLSFNRNFYKWCCLCADWSYCMEPRVLQRNWPAYDSFHSCYNAVIHEPILKCPIWI